MYSRVSSPPAPPGQQSLDAPLLATLPFLNARQRLGQDRLQPVAQHASQDGLTQGFSLDRIVRATVRVASVAFDDDGQMIIADLLFGERNPTKK